MYSVDKEEAYAEAQQHAYTSLGYNSLLTIYDLSPHVRDAKPGSESPKRQFATLGEQASSSMSNYGGRSSLTG